MVILSFVVGLLMLVAGAELLVKGASRIASGAGLSPLAVGLTVVAFGTSAPELAVSVQSAVTGQSSVAFGNVVGSNTFNVLAILGLSALITPLAVSSQLVRIDVPVMIGVSLLVTVMAADGRISRLDGGLLFAGIVGYTAAQIIASKRSRAESSASQSERFGPKEMGWSVGLTLLGIALLVGGSSLFVQSAIVFATAFGVSEVVIGLTIVAAGTSLPEVVTSVVASLRGERDIAVGNVVGSNLFNLLGVLGAAGLAAPDGVEVATSVLNFDLPVMIAVAVVCLPIFFTGMSIDRGEGLVLLGYYLAYVAYLVLASTQHEALPAFSSVMLWCIVPATGLFLTVASIRASRKQEFTLRLKASDVPSPAPLHPEESE